MKDDRFIELVNLYIDRQITPAETGELEAELQADPQRRRVYQQYCRMHRATQLVYESFRQEAGREAPQTTRQGGTLVRLQGARHRRQRWLVAFGGMAAAACVGLLVSRVMLADDEAGAPAAGRVAVSTPATAAPAPTALASVPIGPATAPASYSLVSLRNPLALESDFHAAVAARRLEEAQRALTVLPRGRSLFDEEIFGSQPLLPVPEPRTYRTRRGAPAQGATEFTAFQFQR